MPSQAFTVAKKIGRWFEALVRAEIMKMATDKRANIRLIDTDRQSYQQKQGNDCLIYLTTPDGTIHRCKLEIKLDRMSQATGNVYLDLDSINKSDSPIWAIGLPEGEPVEVKYQGIRFTVGRTIRVYTMFHKHLAPYARQCPRRSIGGEFKLSNPTPAKAEFLAQPFINKFRTIELAPQINQ